MRLTLLLLLLSLAYFATAQTFTEATNTPFEGVWFSSIAFSDVNGNGYEDVLISGWNSSFDEIAKLYINDGTGHFTEKPDTPFDGVYFSSVAFSDVDGDGHEDVLITGRNESEDRIAKLYINNGTGHFTEMNHTPFDDVDLSSIFFSDVNVDGYEDVLITGENSSEERTAKLYINDGTGHFTERTDTPFDGVAAASIAFSDVNDDRHPDLLITGRNSSDERIAKLYINDGTGNFTERVGTPFDGVDVGSIAFTDINDTGHKDLLITGRNGSSERIAKLYINDGTGHFTERMDTPFEGVAAASIAFSDVNGDGHEDVLITGENISEVPITKLYINDGSGNFTETTGMPFEDAYFGSISFSDVNGNGYEDVLITGRNNSDDPISKLYFNNGVTNSTENLTQRFDLELTLYPNPTSSNQVNVSFNSKQLGFAILNLFDVKGHLLLQQKEFAGIGEQTLPIDITSLSPGSYFIQLDAGNRKGTATLVVQ